MDLQTPQRVISISLPEADWKAFLEVQPEPVDWLKARIEEVLHDARRPPAKPRA